MPVKIETKAVEAEEVKKPTKTNPATTNWGACERVGLVPTEVLCQAYHPVHRVDMSCHTRIVPSAENMIAHYQSEHGGAFKVSVKRVEGKAWAGWKDLKERGVECFDFRCDVCNAIVPFHPQYIMQHMRAHQGKNRRIQPGGVFWMTIGIGPATPQGEEAYAELDTV